MQANGNITVSSGQLIAKGGATAGGRGDSTGVRTGDGWAVITVSGTGVLVGIGGAAGDYGSASRGVYSAGICRVSDTGTLIGTGGTVEDANNNSYGIQTFGGVPDILGGTTIAKGHRTAIIDAPTLSGIDAVGSTNYDGGTGEEAYDSSKCHSYRYFRAPANAPIVTSVAVAPQGESVVRGGTKSFSATVTGTRGPAQTATWRVSGQISPATTISASGLLTVGGDETAGTLTVTATSTADPTKSDTAALTVIGADIGSVTVSGTTGTAITPEDATIALTNDRFNALAADADVSSWFTNLPAGLAAKIKTAVTANATTATVTFSGTPTAISADAMAITIPAVSLVGGAALTVTANPDAKWDIITPNTVATPAFSPAAGTYTSAQSVTISCATNGATVRYTSDGTLPTESSTAYSAPVAIATTAILKAKAFKTGMTESNLATAAYTINNPVPPAPSSVPGSGGNWGVGGYTGNQYPGTWNNGVVTVQADKSKLVSVTVDNVQLTEAVHFSATIGSTVITFTPSYLASLQDGAHTIRVQFTDGRYDGTFTTPFTSAVAASPVLDVPNTGDAPLLAKVIEWLLSLAVMSN